MQKLYGAPGWGSAISEIMFTLADEAYQLVDVTGFDKPGPARERLLAVNPLAQVPTLVRADGSVMTETAAIALMLLNENPHLAPSAGTPQRQQFYRLLIWLVANVYPTLTYGDYPARWVNTAPEELESSTDRYRESLYLWLESQAGEGPYWFGEQVSLLDAYFPVIMCWRPRKAWFEQHTPKLVQIAENVRSLPVLERVVGANQLKT
ncbi:glutathione S-transferase family protein [Erwinia oleae]|uniref:glutathione S-transferase family protein n=1 Tax=Erwinia oleae TaxID=796334 RepID=UPI0005555390|nr:glutathione S-transferase [Erwinia oleae]